MLLEYPALNGGERSLLSVLPFLVEAGIRLVAGAPADGPVAAALAEQRIAVHPLALADESGRTLPQDARRRRIGELVRRVGPQLVHANSLSMARLSGPVVRRLGVVGIGHVRDIVRLSRTATEDVNCHDRLLAVSHATRDYHCRAGMDADKTFVLYNGVDLRQFHPRAKTGYLHEQLGVGRDAPLVGTIGQLGLRKGIDTFVDAAQQVIAVYPRTHFLIVGRRHSQKDESVRCEAAIRAAAANRPMAGHVHFLGYRNDVDRLLGELTLLVHPARQEPLGRVLLEAAAAGRPVVATDVGGTAEIFPRRAGAALLVPPDEPVPLARAVCRLLGDTPLRRQLAARARRRAEEAFAVEASAALLAGHYRDLLGDG